MGQSKLSICELIFDVALDAQLESTSIYADKLRKAGVDEEMIRDADTASAGDLGALQSELILRAGCASEIEEISGGMVTVPQAKAAAGRLTPFKHRLK